MNLTLSIWATLLGRLATEAVLLVALATVAQRFVTSPRARGTLWQAVLLGIALVWTAELADVRGQIAHLWPQPREARKVVTTIVDRPAPNLIISEVFEPMEEPVAASVATKPVEPVWWPLQLWLAGFAALLFRATALRLWLGFAASRRTRITDSGLLDRVAHIRRRVGLRRVRMLVWPGLRSPIAFGTLRPTIALPADFAVRFNHEAQEAMLAHELAHLAARDPLWLALADLVLALAWWHPAVWWARWQLRAASEATADEASALVPGGRVALAESLVTFGRELAAPGWARGLGVAGDGLKSQLARRVTALLRHTGEWRAARPARLWLARGVALIIATTLVALPWPGGSGPALAAVIAEARAIEGLPKVTGTDPTLPRVVERLDPNNPSGMIRDYLIPNSMMRSNSGALPPGIVSEAGDEFKNLAHLDYAASHARSPASANPAGLSISPPPSVGFLPDANTKSQETSAVPADWKQPAHSVYVALRSEDSTNETSAAKMKPAAVSEMQRRYQQAKEAAKEADLASIPILAKYGADSAEFTRAKERFQKALEKTAILEGVIASDKELEELRAHYKEEHPKVVVAQAARAGLLAKLDDLSRAEVKAAELFTRQFRLRGEQNTGFSEHLRRFMPAGDTNIQAAVRAFFATNGVAMSELRRDTTNRAVLQSQKATFFNDRTGVLFVRATLDDMDRIEKALQYATIPPAEADEIRAGQAKQMEASMARLAELRAQYGNSHPKVLEELDSQASIRASQSQMALNGRTATTNRPPARQIDLKVQFVELTDENTRGLSLDWVFGHASTNSPMQQSGPATNILTEPGAPHGRNLRVDLLRTDGESATLTTAQFAALWKQLDSRDGVDFLTAPRIITESGRQARVEVSQMKTIVSGVETAPVAGTKKTAASYQTEDISVGPKVDIIPTFEGENARLGIVATVTEFLGYDQPLSPPDTKSSKMVTPLPRLRVRVMHADAMTKPGEMLVLRGPSVTETLRTKDKVVVLGDVPLLGRLFRSESTRTVHKRLYVFVTPVEVTATGELVPAKATSGQ